MAAPLYSFIMAFFLSTGMIILGAAAIATILAILFCIGWCAVRLAEGIWNRFKWLG